MSCVLGTFSWVLRESPAGARIVSEAAYDDLEMYLSE